MMGGQGGCKVYWLMGGQGGPVQRPGQAQRVTRRLNSECPNEKMITVRREPLVPLGQVLPAVLLVVLQVVL